MTAVRMAANLSFPDDAATQTHAFLARKGGGKTYAAGVLVEGLLALGVPVVVIDPVGNWHGLQIDRDGRKRGYDIPVFGGRHGNIPLALGQSEALARLLVTRNLPAVVDVSGFRARERKQFVAEFGESLFHEVKSTPRPRTIVYEEAQLFAPQRERGSEPSLASVEDIVRLGRNYALGSVLISQRPQSVNKEVLSQVESLFVGQLGARQDRDAIENWITERGSDRLLLKELPRLQPGEMLFWSPQWLRTFKRVHIAQKKTLDASATLSLSKQPLPPRAAAMQTEELQAALLSYGAPKNQDSGATRGKPPRERADQQRIVELEAECATLRAQQFDRAHLQHLARRVSDQLHALQQLSAELAVALGASPGPTNAARAVAPQSLKPSKKLERTAQPPAPLATQSPRERDASGLRAGALRMLNVLATFYPGSLTRAQIARAAGLRVNSGTTSTYWSNLKQQGLLEDAGRDLYRATARGLEALGASRPEAPKTFAERRAFWEARLRAGERRLLSAVITAGEGGLTRDELAGAVEMSATSGTFSTYLSTLQNNRLTTREGDHLVVHPWLLHGPTAA